MSKLQLLLGISQGYVQYLTAMRKHQSFKYNIKTQKAYLYLKNHLMTPFDFRLKIYFPKTNSSWESLSKS